jgi:hypothetical protein
MRNTTRLNIAGLAATAVVACAPIAYAAISAGDGVSGARGADSEGGPR